MKASVKVASCQNCSRITLNPTTDTCDCEALYSWTKRVESDLALSFEALGLAWALAPSAPEISAPEIPGNAIIRLLDHGPNKIQVVKVVRESFMLGLKQAVEFVEAAPTDLPELYRPEADNVMHQLVLAGALVELLPV